MSREPLNLSALRAVAKPICLLDSPALSDQFNAHITLLCENFQHTGSFKFRAAYQVAVNVPQTTLLTVSSGNFGRALAYACQLLGKTCHVIMPDNASRTKIQATRDFGACVYLVDTRQKSRSAYLAELSTLYPDAYVASPYDDAWVIAGNASLSVELGESGQAFDDVIVPIGGGGLSSGIIVGLRAQGLSTQVTGAEPLLANDAARSLRAGYRIANTHEPQTLADGARTLSLGQQNWDILQKGLERIIEIPEAAIGAAVRLLYETHNLTIEPTGALSVATLLTAPEYFKNRKVCCVISGGNVDPVIFQNLLVP